MLGLGELGKAIAPETPENSQEKRAASEFYAAMDWVPDVNANSPCTGVIVVAELWRPMRKWVQSLASGKAG